MKLLELLNFRSFARLSLIFDPGLTVLVAPNGLGKTAILDALAIAWSPFLDELSLDVRPVGFSRDDVRRVIGPERTMERILPTELQAEALISGQPLQWGQELKSERSRKRTVQRRSDPLRVRASDYRRQVTDYAEGLRAEAPVLPMLCYYGTGRLWNTQSPVPPKKASPPDTSRFGGYAGCLSPASTFGLFEAWFRRFAYEAQRELASHQASPHQPRDRLAGVRAAVSTLLRPSGWQDLGWDFAEDVLCVTHAEHGRLPVRLLSDGIRSMVGLAGDLAHRAVLLNPHLGAEAPQKTPGVVLIDEVDMHLHPAWQQTVVTGLREAFPAMQFIVTTHSHLVVSTVPSRSVRILESDGRVSEPSAETQGYDSPFALGVVFGVDSAPPIEIAAQLSKYRALLEQGYGEGEEARRLQELLLKHFGAQHPAMLAADGIRRLQAFKARVAAGRAKA